MRCAKVRKIVFPSIMINKQTHQYNCVVVVFVFVQKKKKNKNAQAALS